MSLFLLDTDHVSLWFRGHSSISARAAQSSSNITVTIVTVQELFNGWVVNINNPSSANNLVELYTRFWATVEFLQSVRILNFDAAADTQYRRLLKEHPPLRKNRIQKDVRIAAIALSVNGVLVTRNQRDFAQVPGLVLEDWTQNNI
ncbi:type II toxin-antitoxin system VapC family toxin [Iningainema tapete]|uniref:Type II toxin-antitoxin system VapC family toxin n=1 Tax=Iningainema tapete BLCC-T55 TaxID=2748662 RepID=A0A8J7CF75_9CYAN|nr:type II toxin-antitoxin system VapC family toxin [Iningainema tapete]MBD2774435.1 type II toxin-antitoxin system VapC family toxin [Iningainema tapete BLCC-T55]